MLLALGAMSSAIDALQSLTGSKSSAAPKTGFNNGAGNPFDIDGNAAAGGSGPSTGTALSGSISPETMRALLEAQGRLPNMAPVDPVDALKHMFSQIDGNGDGKISKSEFENALGAGGTNVAQADSVFGKLDANGDDGVSLKEMANALMGRGHRHHHTSSASGDVNDGSNSDPLLQALNGASSTSVTDSDGSTTITITYADGSKVSMTSPPAPGASSTATSSYNWLERMVQREAKMLAASAASSVSITA